MVRHETHTGSIAEAVEPVFGEARLLLVCDPVDDGDQSSTNEDQFEDPRLKSFQHPISPG